MERAIALIDGGAFDLALLDGNLGGRPVDELAAAVTRRNIPFVFITGYGRASLPKAFSQVPIIAKPFSREQLLGTLAQILRQKGDVIPLRQKSS